MLPRLRTHRLTLRGLLLMLAATAPVCVGAADPGSGPLIVATKETPPFVVRTEDGALGGFAIELWEEIADRAGVDFEYREYALEELITAVSTGDADVGVGALTLTAQREQRLDFTHSWLEAGFAIAVPKTRSSAWLVVLQRFVSLEFLSVLAALVLLLLGTGGALWLAERRRNPEQFGGDAPHGIGEGFWWAAVTMTTVGYGDRVPVTGIGRAIAMVWMFTALIVVSTFTAAITTSLTVGELDSGISDLSDLGRGDVVTVGASASAAWLADRRIAFVAAPDVETALERVADGRADALVYDEPLLRYLVADRYADSIDVLPGHFDRQEYAFVTTTGHPAREALNLAILEILSEPEWQARLAELSP
ncbi:MAG: transporter substrate-binding domain-containing protein [Pseudomonadales bacterium]|nr:transporter substrate-binding domain-containing protein [Pseudomonadales bacterium]